jgi:multimeric flavodoxin WrbA
MLHASDKATSNTLQIGTDVCKYLRPHCSVQEISLQNGAVYDCRGCSYKMCSHYAAQNSCFYGGSIVNDVYPAVTDCDALLLLCPNYNDSVSANILAFINRLTALLVNTSFYNKYLYAVVVSGYSGSDLVAQQLLGALCLNKTFMLPPHFCLMQTANDPGEAMKTDGMPGRIEVFANEMLKTILAK